MVKVKRTRTRGPDSAQARRRTTRARRILVVDDDIGIRQLNAELLITCGYQVDAAEDGAEGWDALHARSYDLLITDNNMPRISGVELVRKVRSAHMALPVIMASGARPAEELGLQLEAILLKPFTGDQLLGEVKRVLHEADMPKKPILRCQSAKPFKVS